MKVDTVEPKQSPREWLAYPENEDDDKRPKIKWVFKSSEGRVDIAGMTPKEVEAVESFIVGSSYIRCVNGRLHAYHAWEPLPDAEADPICGPHWGTDGTTKEFGGLGDEKGWNSPGITITGLGAGIENTYGDAAESRKRNQKRVQDCGFVCLRSPRSKDGQYWEQWVLHSLFFAKGPLREHVDKLKELDWKQQAEAACRFIAQDLGIRFGSMDITIQRWALCCPD